MSRRACLLTTQDVPNYIKEIASRLQPVLINHTDAEGNNWWGYTFRLDAKWKCGYESQLINDTEKLIKWAKSWYAYADIIQYQWWADRYPDDGMGGSWKSRCHKACREGFRNHVYITISDPVANVLEKNNFFR